MTAQNNGHYPNGNRSGPEDPALTQPALQVDFERYEHILANSGLTEEQKQEFLESLWAIIVNFVSLGWGVHPLQQVEMDCGKLPASNSESVFAPEDMIDSRETIGIKKTFAETTGKGGCHDNTEH